MSSANVAMLVIAAIVITHVYCLYKEAPVQDRSFGGFVRHCSAVLSRVGDRSPSVTGGWVRIPKVNTSAVFSEELIAIHGFPYHHDFSRDETSALMTAAFVTPRRDRFACEDFEFIFTNCLLVYFADLIVRNINYRRKIITSSLCLHVFASTQQECAANDVVVDDLCRIAAFMQQLSRGRREVLTLYCFMLDIPKAFDPALGLSPGDQRFVNSAEVADENVVMIFRKEEIRKVLIHEMVHSMHLEEFGGPFPTCVDEDIFRLDETSFTDMNEALTETIAIVLYSIYFHLSTPGSLTLASTLQEQLRFAAGQSAKLLLLNGFRNTTDLKAVTIHQTTDALSYYVRQTSALDAFLQRPDASMTAMLFGSTSMYSSSPISAKDRINFFVGIVKSQLSANSHFRSQLGSMMQQPLLNMSLRMSSPSVFP